MSLEMRRGNQWWYARRVVNGRRTLLKLKVQIRGVRPPSLRGVGDAQFEESRAVARAAMARRIAEIEGHPDADWYRRMADLLSERQTRRDALALDELLEAWTKAPHARDRSPRYLERAGECVRQFVRIMGSLPEPPAHAGAVSPDHADAWARSPEIASLAPGTFNSKLVLLRSVLWAVRRQTGCTVNPFASVPMRRHEAVHRVPMSPAEVRRVVECADSTLRGPLVTAACTAMRLGDCCRLTWDSVDLSGGWIRARTHKTGEPVEIPILPMLRRELQAADAGRRPGDSSQVGRYVWPKAWLMYEGNRAGLSYRMRRALDAAGVVRSVAREARGAAPAGSRKGAGPKRRAAVRDFHALRTTWITTAIENGVPMDLVRKVTGHRTVDVVLRHYVHPGREALGKSVRKAMRRLGA